MRRGFVLSLISASAILILAVSAPFTMAQKPTPTGFKLVASPSTMFVEPGGTSGPNTTHITTGTKDRLDDPRITRLDLEISSVSPEPGPYLYIGLNPGGQKHTISRRYAKNCYLSATADPDATEGIYTVIITGTATIGRKKYVDTVRVTVIVKAPSDLFELSASPTYHIIPQDGAENSKITISLKKRTAQRIWVRAFTENYFPPFDYWFTGNNFKDSGRSMGIYSAPADLYADPPPGGSISDSLNIAVYPDAQPGYYKIKVQGFTWPDSEARGAESLDFRYHNVIIAVSVPPREPSETSLPKPDYELSISRDPVILRQGWDTFINTTLSPKNDFQQSVRARVSVVPLGVVADFSAKTIGWFKPILITQPVSYKPLELHIMALADAPLGDYRLTVFGESFSLWGSSLPKIHRSTSITVRVVADIPTEVEPETKTPPKKKPPKKDPAKKPPPTKTPPKKTPPEPKEPKVKEPFCASGPLFQFSVGPGLRLGEDDIDRFRIGEDTYLGGLPFPPWTSSYNWPSSPWLCDPEFKVQFPFRPPFLRPTSLGNGGKADYSIGTGIGFTRNKTEGTYSATREDTELPQSQTWDYDHSFLLRDTYIFVDGNISIQPPCLSNFPGKPFLNAYFGMEYNFGKLDHDMAHSTDYIFEDYTTYYYSADLTRDEVVKDSALGIRYGIGSKFQLNDYLSLGVELFGKSANFNDWSGTWTDVRNWDDNGTTGSETQNFDGQLWTYTGKDSSGNGFRGLEVNNEMPDGDFMNVEPAAIKLNRMGIRLTVSFCIERVLDMLK